MSEDLISKLEDWGEDDVGIRLARGEFGAKGLDRQRVEDWLSAKSETRSALSSREQIRLAHSAKNAAWAAAIAAIIAAISAVIAVWPRLLR